MYAGTGKGLTSLSVIKDSDKPDTVWFETEEEDSEFATRTCVSNKETLEFAHVIINMCAGH